MAPPRRFLYLFPDLNTSLIEIADTGSFEPQQSVLASVLSFPMMLVEQAMVVQSDIDANHYTLRSYVETVTVVSNLSHRLQNMTSDVQRLNTQLSLLQRMFKDA
ncbi:hypothetical protein ACSBR1_009027 [Camellia fascicularis]